MSGLGIHQTGNLDELASICDHVLEMDLSKNEFDDWDEVSLLGGEGRDKPI